MQHSTFPTESHADMYVIIPVYALFFFLVAHKHHVSDQQFITQKSTAILNNFVYIWNTVKVAYVSYH